MHNKNIFAREHSYPCRGFINFYNCIRSFIFVHTVYVKLTCKQKGIHTSSLKVIQPDIIDLVVRSKGPTVVVVHSSALRQQDVQPKIQRRHSITSLTVADKTSENIGLCGQIINLFEKYFCNICKGIQASFFFLVRKLQIRNWAFRYCKP
jgi:hypothetical protein